MKALRVILAVLGGVLALLIIAAIVFISRFDPNDYKDEITAFVQERTGRTLSIDREIGLSLFPWFAVETGGITLSDDPAFGDRDFAVIDELAVRVRVWPLLKRRVEIGRVILDGVTLNLGTDSDGRGNWASLREAAAPSATAAPSPSGSDRPLIEALAVEGIELRNARVLWHDPDGEVRYLLRELNLGSGPIRDAEPIELELELAALDVASQTSIEIELDTVADAAGRVLDDIEARIRVFDSREQERARASLSLDSLALTGTLVRSAPVEMEITLTRPPVGPESLTVAVTAAGIEFDADSERAVVNGLSVRSGGIETSWNLSAERVLAQAEVAGTVSLQSRSIAEVFDLLGLAAPADVDLGQLGGLTGSADFALGISPPRVELDNVRLAAAGVDATGSARLAADGAATAHILIPPQRPSPGLLDLLAPYLPAGTELGAITRARAEANLALTPDRRRLEVTGLALALDSLQLEGALTVVDAAGTPELSGRLTAAGLDNRLLTALAGPALPSDLLATELGAFSLAAEFDYSSATRSARVDPLALTAWGLTGAGQVTVDASGSALSLAGRASLDEFSPRALLTRFDLPVPESSDPDVFRSARLAADFETAGDSGFFRNITVQLDDSTISGNFSVENFADPSYRFDLRADAIDVDRYLPPEAADAPEAAAAAAAGDRSVGEIRLSNQSLSATRISGTASVGDLRLGGLRFEQFETSLAVGDGRMALDRVSTALYGGSFSGSFAVDAAAAEPSIRLSGMAAAVALKPLLDDLLGDSSLSGTGSVELELTGRGDTIAAALATTAGSMSFAFRDGDIAGINVGRELCAGMNALNSLPRPAAAPDATHFTTIQGSATVSDGVATTTDLYASTGSIELTGTGRIRLEDQWLRNDYIARLKGPIELAGCERVNSRIDSSIPIGFWIEGIFPDIEFGFDYAELIKDWARREVGQRVEEELRDRILRNIFE